MHKWGILLSLFILSYAHANWVESYLKWKNVAIGSAHISESVYSPQLLSASSYEDLRLLYGHNDLRHIYWAMTEEQIEQNNENIERLLEMSANFDNEVNGFQAPQDAVKELSYRQVKKIFRDMTRTRVVRYQRRYGDEDVGFCFGRALIAHQIALVRNIHPAYIAKIWVVGDMGLWGHHVATMLKTNRGWYAIDDYTGLLPIDKWMRRMRQDRRRGNDLMFFITRAARFGPANNMLYNSYDLFNKPEEELINFTSKSDMRTLKESDFYNGFFIDFYNELADDEEDYKKFRTDQRKNFVALDESELEELLAQKEEQSMADDIDMSEITSFQFSRKSIYCFNHTNPVLNCTFDSNTDDYTEQSKSVSGLKQYLIQNNSDETIYAKHILDEKSHDVSYQIVEDQYGNLSKYIVKIVKPIYTGKRPYIKFLSRVVGPDQETLRQEIKSIKDLF